jgi:hypothetical protein
MFSSSAGSLVDGSEQAKNMDGPEKIPVYRPVAVVKICLLKTKKKEVKHEKN